VEAANGSSEPFTISGNGKQVRDILHVDDLVDLYAAVLDNADSVAGEVFNIGGGMASSLSLLELFSLLERLTGAVLRHRQIEPRQSDQKVFVADIEKASRRLGWTPAVGPQHGIAKTLDWIEKKRPDEPVRK
jgi:CDP-paratose 2-epimerase